jgi:Domain of unknown function (DUF4374)
MLMGLACGEGSDATTVDGEPSERGPYFAATSIWTPETDISMSYSRDTSEVDETLDSKLKAGFESPGWIRPTSHEGAIFVPDGENPTITKYTTDAADNFLEGATISFANSGVTSTAFGAPAWGENMLAKDRAYLTNDENLELIVWNPEAMLLTGKAIDLSEALTAPIANRVGYSPTLGQPVHRGNRVFYPVRWQNWDATLPEPAIVPTGGLLVVDTDTDEVVHLLQDDRLTDTIYTALTDSGDIYLFTGAYGVSYNYVQGSETGRPGGALRVLAGQDTFDPDYYVNLEDKVGARPVTGPVYAGGTSVYMRAYHEEMGGITADVEADPQLLVNQEAWRYWKVDLEGTTPSQEITEVPWGATNASFFSVRKEGRVFLGALGADFSSTTLYEATSAGFVRAATVTGYLQSLSLL